MQRHRIPLHEKRKQTHPRWVCLHNPGWMTGVEHPISTALPSITRRRSACFQPESGLLSQLPKCTRRHQTVLGAEVRSPAGSPPPTGPKDGYRQLRATGRSGRVGMWRVTGILQMHVSKGYLALFHRPPAEPDVHVSERPALQDSYASFGSRISSVDVYVTLMT